MEALEGSGSETCSVRQGSQTYRSTDAVEPVLLPSLKNL